MNADLVKTKQSVIDALRFNDKEKKIGIKFKERKCHICGETHPEDFLYYQFTDRNYEQMKEDLMPK